MRQNVRHHRREAGFSLIELLIVILLLSIIMGSVFSQIDLVQKRFRSEEVKLDIFQTAREFVDQMVRDVHQSGFPNVKMYASGALNGTGTAPYYEDSDMNAVGIVSIDTTRLRIEGDVDGDGAVDAVGYYLVEDTTAKGNENCPCIRRSQVLKASGVLPKDQEQDYRTQVENVQYNTKLGNQVVFRAWNKDGTEVTLPDDSSPLFRTNFDPKDAVATNPTDDVNKIWTVQVLLNVRSATADIGTGVRPEVYLTATAQINN